jgi:N-acetylmuramoyl-L-alanine amidase
MFAASELQGLVVLGTDWGYEQGSEAQQAKITEIIRSAKEQNYNAIYFQVREAGESFYPASDGSWSTMFNEEDPGFDPLELALSVAHSEGLQLYAQFDALSAYSLVNRPNSEDHLYMNKGKIWIVADDSFNPIEDNATYFLDPSIPQVVTYLKDQVHELITNYEIDGIHFTHLYYPGNKISKTQAFLRQHKNINDFSRLDLKTYAQTAITSCLEALSAEVKLVKPYLLISAEARPLLKETRSVKGYEPADTYYFQDGISWLEKGLVDVLVPKLHVRSKSFNTLFNLYFNSTSLGQYIIPSLRGDEESFRENDLKKEMDYAIKSGVKGCIVHSAEDAFKEKEIFNEKADLPYLSRTHNTVKALQLDLSEFEVPNEIVFSEYDNGFHIVDQNNQLNLIVTDMPRYLKLKTMQDNFRFQTRGWVPPMIYRVVSRNEVERPAEFIELRKAPNFISKDSSFAFLFRASRGDTKINGESIDAYSNTQIFFKELSFAPLGKVTKVRGSVTTRDNTLFYEDIYFGNMPDTTTKRAVVMESVSPRDTVILPPDDVLRVSFSSMLADEMDTILLYVNGTPLPLYYNGSRYVGDVPCKMFASTGVAYLQVAARDIYGKNYSYNLPLTLFIENEYNFPVVESKIDFAQVSYSLGEVRLGGPYMQEYPKGVRFKTSGKFGSSYRVQLSKTDFGYVPEKEVRVLPAGTPKPQFNLYNMSVRPDTTRDLLTIPWPEPVPYTVLAQPEQNRIRIRLYGVHSNSTWITHREGLQVIDHISWEQRDAETYDIYVNLKDNNIWGYDIKQNEKSLSFWVKYPPVRNDIRIAIEAGHGGEWNWGAVGLSGLKEKDVNRDTAEKLRDILTEMGYEVIEVRPEDADLRLRDRWLMVDSLDADIFVSIHANAAGGGYLRVAGTSTYYHNPFWRDYAELGYDKLRELDLEEFGTVGSFNYMMCRMSARPSMLVEQAFMSHAEDENKLADPEFRRQMAEKVAETINEYINDKLSR